MITNGHTNSLYSSVRTGGIGFGATHEGKETGLQELGSGAGSGPGAWPGRLAQVGAQVGAAPILAGPTPHSRPTASLGNSTWWWSFSLPRKPK